MITGNDQVSVSSERALQNSVVVGIGLDDMKRNLGLHNFGNAHNKL